MVTFPLTVRDGAVSWDKDAFVSTVRGLPEGRYVLTLKEYQQARTYRQLRYWFGLPMKALSETTGYTKMQCHYLCLALCFGVVIDPVTGRDIPVVPFSRGLTAAQFGELMEWFPPWAWDLHKISVPLPHEVDIDSLPGYEEAA